MFGLVGFRVLVGVWDVEGLFVGVVYECCSYWVVADCVLVVVVVVVFWSVDVF